MNKKVLGILIALLFASLIASYLGLEYYKKLLLTQAKPALIGGDKDSHGCIVSGGYTYDSEITACVRPWEIDAAKREAAAAALKSLRASQKFPTTGVYLVGVSVLKCQGCNDVYLQTGSGSVTLLETRAGITARPKYVEYADIPEDAVVSEGSSGDGTSVDPGQSEPGQPGPGENPVDDTPVVEDPINPENPGGPISGKYSCPKSGYIDCMPVIGAEKRAQCDTQYLAWVQANCPDFEGVAY